jgi:hypothetical protein
MNVAPMMVKVRLLTAGAKHHNHIVYAFDCVRHGTIFVESREITVPAHLPKIADELG